jgi:hypothetical protein
VRREDFESLARLALDEQLNACGFHLVPQPPGDFFDDRPAALYEADPDDFGLRYPALDPRIRGITPCVDLWFHLDKATGKVTADLDGTPLANLAEELGLSAPVRPTDVSRDIEHQLSRLASRIVAALDMAKKK